VPTHRSLAKPGDDGHLSTTANILVEIDRLIRDARGVLTEVSRNTDLDQDDIGTVFLVNGEDFFHRLKIIETQVETLRSCVEIDDRRHPDPYRTDILGLSSRETEVGRLISGGFTNQQIARRLHISHKTVETYIARIFKKLDVLSRAEIARIFGFLEG
jgi:DNA-binding CsgD family transcriptional regulator